MTLSLVGLSHHVAPVELRERVTLDLPSAPPRSRARSATPSASRPATAPSCTSSATTRRAPSRRSSSSPASRSTRVAYRLHDEAAALHLFRVAAGLDSLVPGEGEILGQVRAAFEAASPGPLLDRVFRQALAVGKRVRTETAIGESPASVSSAAAALAAQVFGDLGGPARAADRRRPDRRARRRRTSRRAAPRSRTSRTARPSAARALAARFGGEALALDEIGARLGEVDVVVSSTSAPELVVRAADVPARRREPLFFIDIAVPRDLDPAIAQLDGCFLYDIDDLEAVVAETLAGRRAEAERAEQLVAEEAERFRAWRASLDVVPAIASLRARAEEIRSAELAKVEGRVSDDERRTLESVTAQILNKLLHLPTVRMKEAAVSADGAAYADAVRHLFGLEEER